LSKEGVSPSRSNNRAIPWQQSCAYNHPLLFVIPPAPACRGSEADLSRPAVEESAVRPSGAPNLSVYNYPSRLSRGIQTAPQELDFIRSSQADTSGRSNYAACRGARSPIVQGGVLRTWVPHFRRTPVFAHPFVSFGPRWKRSFLLLPMSHGCLVTPAQKMRHRAFMGACRHELTHILLAIPRCHRPERPVTVIQERPMLKSRRPLYLAH
jgi:hypothetical protein